MTWTHRFRENKRKGETDMADWFRLSKQETMSQLTTGGQGLGSREAKERQRQADEKMWSTPLESFGADEAAERAKKYENTDTHTQ